MGTSTDDRPSPSIFINIVHVFTLCSLVFSFPLYSFLIGNPSYFVTNDVWPGTIYYFTAMMMVTLPAILIAPALIGRLFGKKVHWRIHLGFVAFLITLSFLPILKAMSFLPSWIVVILATGLAVLATRQYATNNFIYKGLLLLTPLVLVFPTWFLLNDDMRQILDQHKTVPALETTLDVEKAPPIMYVVFDEFPLIDLLDADGEIDGKRFPNFATLSEGATWYANATTIHDYTLKAVPSILSGNYPVPGPVIPIRSNYPETMYTLLEKHYDIHSAEAITKLAKVVHYEKYQVQSDVILEILQKDIYVMYLHATLPKDIATLIEPMEDGLWGGFMKYKREEGTRGRIKRMHHWFKQQNEVMGVVSKKTKLADYLKEMGEYPARTFHFLHVLIPHAPYEFLPSGKAYNYRQYAYGRDVINIEDTVLFEKHSRQAHLLQVGYADTVVGDVIRTLKDQNIYDDSLIVFVADHGVNFKLEHKNRTLSENNIGSVGFVPLFIKYPNQKEGGVDWSNVQTIDIAPTIVDVLGLEGAYEMDGRSLVDPAAVAPEQKKLINRKDTVYRLTEAEYTAIRAKELEDYIEEYSLDHPKATLFHHGPGLDWIGEPQSVIRENSIEATITCETVGALESVDPDADYIPARLLGLIETKDETPLEEMVVVACVNGTAQGVTEPFIAEEGVQFELILSEEVFKEQGNEIALFLMPLP